MITSLLYEWDHNRQWDSSLQRDRRSCTQITQISLVLAEELTTYVDRISPQFLFQTHLASRICFSLSAKLMPGDVQYLEIKQLVGNCVWSLHFLNFYHFPSKQVCPVKNGSLYTDTTRCVTLMQKLHPCDKLCLQDFIHFTGSHKAPD